MNKDLTKKLKKTTSGVRQLARIVDEPVDKKKVASVVSKWSRLFETVVDIIEVYVAKD
jgi:hypothetical protein